MKHRRSSTHVYLPFNQSLERPGLDRLVSLRSAPAVLARPSTLVLWHAAAKPAFRGESRGRLQF